MIRALIGAAAFILAAAGVTRIGAQSQGAGVSGGLAVRGDAANDVCDQGPNNAVPKMAAAAGFTHCALNADFTQVGGFFGKVSNFLDGCGGTGNRLFQAYYAYSGAQVPCNKMTIEQDSGSQVLHLSYSPGDSSSVGTTRPLELAYPTLKHNGAVQSGWPQPASPGTENLPQKMYTEITFRMPKYSLDTVQLGQNIPFAWWQMDGTAADHTPQKVEIDYIEINSDSNYGSGWNNGTSMIEWGCGNNCATPTSPPITHVDYTQYHKFGILVTSDEHTNFAKCLFMDDVLQGCQTISPHTAIAYHTDRSKFLNYVVVWAGNNGPEVNNPVDIYIKSISVWECNSYLTTTCPGSTYYSSAGLTYWH